MITTGPLEELADDFIYRLSMGDRPHVAYKDVLVVISNCPQLYNPCNGWSPTPIRIIQWQPSS